MVGCKADLFVRCRRTYVLNKFFNLSSYTWQAYADPLYQLFEPHDFGMITHPTNHRNGNSSSTKLVFPTSIFIYTYLQLYLAKNQSISISLSVFTKDIQ